MDSCFFSSLIPYQSLTTNPNLGSSPVIIRTFEASDLKSLSEVLSHSFHPPQGLVYWLYPLLKLGIYEDLRSRLRSNSPQYKCLVASKLIPDLAGQKEEIVGSVEIALYPSSLWSTRKNPYPYISNLAVSNLYRRQGIARKLLIKCEQIAWEWGFQEISLHVLEDNYQAKQLYLTSGYQLQRIESNLACWLLQQPRRALLHKKLVNNNS